MRGAVPTQQRWTSLFRREEGRFLAVFSFAFVGACSVYTNSLVDGTAQPVTEGGSNAGAGRGGSGSAGAPNPSGGTQDTPSDGGEGGDTDPSGGTGATGGSAGSSTGGGDVGGTGGATGGVGGSSGGGAGGVSGSAGSGGGVSDNPLVDGFEDNNLFLTRSDGRGGVWYTFTDKTTGTIAPNPLVCSPLQDAPAELGSYAMHITASGFTAYGSGLGADFRAEKKLYDASRYTGIRFWAKVGTGAGTTAKHRFQIPDINTDAAGLKCTGPDAPLSAKCDDHHGAELLPTTEWKQYRYDFADLATVGWGYPDSDEVPLATTSLYGLQFAAEPGATVDLWIDQVEFY